MYLYIIYKSISLSIFYFLFIHDYVLSKGEVGRSLKILLNGDPKFYL